MGFLAAECEYWSPPLGLANPQSDMRAHLLVGAREKVSMIKREALVQVVHSVYFDHYGRWYRPFHPNTGDSARYEAILNERFAAYISPWINRESIVLNGVRMLDSPMLPTAVPRAARRPPVLLPLCVALVIALLCAGFFWLQYYLQLPAAIVAIVFTATVVVVVTAFALFDKNARTTLRQLLSAIPRIFGKRE